MFGYIKAEKPDMRFREFDRYRSVYCGLCMALKKYGAAVRLEVSYDMAFLILLFESLEDGVGDAKLSHCIIHPFKKHLIAEPNEFYDAAAAATIMLAKHKVRDNIIDREKLFISRAFEAVSLNAVKKAESKYPELNKKISGMMEAFNKKEKEIREGLNENPKAGIFELSDLSGELLFHVTDFLSHLKNFPENITVTLNDIGRLTGRWIYLIDALDDFEADRKDKSKASLIPANEAAKACEFLWKALTDIEQELEEKAASLPYKKDAGIIGNVILGGMPAQREKIQRKYAFVPN